MTCRYTVSHVCVVLPVLLRTQAVSEVADVRMGVDKAWNDCLTRSVNGFGSGRDSHTAPLSNRFYSVPVDDNNSVFNHFIAFHGYNPCSGEGNPSFGHIRLQREANLYSYGIHRGQCGWRTIN